jgi:hypothetical protein
LDQIKVCRICSKDHATHNCPSLPGLKSIYQKDEEPEKLCYVSQKRPWQPKPQGMIQDQYQYFNSYWTNPSMKYASQPWGMPTQQWVAPPPPNQLWKQGWRNPTMGGPQQPMTQPPMQLLPPPQMQASTSTPPRPQTTYTTHT